MTKSTKFLGIFSLIIILMIGSIDAEAQRKRRSKKGTSRKAKTERVDEDHLSFKEKLWYGSNVNFQLSTGYFLFGLNPMVGYKFTEWLSAGPSIIINYSHEKYAGNNYKYFDYGGGVFTRAKFLDQFFFQAEYDVMSNDTGSSLLGRVIKDQMFVGLGYYANGGNGTWGYQVTLMYDVIAEETDRRVPVSYRLGFNYNL